jgi:hypothetical protein
MDGVTFCGSCGAQINNSPTEQKQAGTNYSTSNNTYSAPAGGRPINGGMIPPKNYMVESIVVTVISFLCCCSPISIILGIIAIVKANNVNAEFERGNINEALGNADAAKKLTIWAAVIAVIFYIIYIVLYFVLFAAVLAEGGFDALFNV